MPPLVQYSPKSLVPGRKTNSQRPIVGQLPVATRSPFTHLLLAQAAIPPRTGSAKGEINYLEVARALGTRRPQDKRRSGSRAFSFESVSLDDYGSCVLVAVLGLKLAPDLLRGAAGGTPLAFEPPGPRWPWERWYNGPERLFFSRTSQNPFRVPAPIW